MLELGFRLQEAQHASSNIVVFNTTSPLPMNNIVSHTIIFHASAVVQDIRVMSRLLGHLVPKTRSSTPTQRWFVNNIATGWVHKSLRPKQDNFRKPPGLIHPETPCTPIIPESPPKPYILQLPNTSLQPQPLCLYGGRSPQNLNPIQRDLFKPPKARPMEGSLN